MLLARRLKTLVPWRRLGEQLLRRGRPAENPKRRPLPPVESADLTYLPDRIDGGDSGALRGGLESVTARAGIVGWVVDLSAANRIHQVELVAGDRVFASARTTPLFRLASHDLGERQTPGVTPSFRFAPAALLGLLDESVERPGRIAVRLAGTQTYLREPSARFAEDVLSVAEAVAALEPAVTFLDPFDISQALDRRRLLADALTERSFQPRKGAFGGHVDHVAFVNGDTLMLVGWLKEPRRIDFAAIIVADRNYPAAFAGLSFPRSDLQTPSIGFVAFVRTDWRPQPGNAITIYWGGAVPRYLKGTPDMRLMSPAEAAHWIVGYETSAGAREYGAFHAAMSKLESWIPAEAGLKDAGLSYGIDAVLVLPGFGVLVAGWLFSPYKRLRNVSARIGQHVVAGEPHSLSLTPRFSSLSDKADTLEKAASKAFRCVALGLPREASVHTPLLQLAFEDGTAYAIGVPRNTLRACEGSEALVPLGRFFQGLVNEPFLDVFVAAFANQARRRAAPEPILTAKARRVVVMSLPSQPDDLLLVLADIRRFAAMLPPDIGLAFLTGARHSRARLHDRLADLGLGAGRPLSLFGVSDPAYALLSLPGVLGRLEAERFCFCGPDALPTQAGWAQAASYLGEGRSHLELFVQHAGSGLPEPESLCFAWDTAAFAAWTETAPFFLAGFHRDNGLPDPAARHAGAIGLLRSMVAVEPVRRIDERLYRAASARPLLQVEG